MNALAKDVQGEQVHGDYTLRTVDYDTRLIGPVTDAIIDADRMVREGWGNCLPNWELYRAALAGDRMYNRPLRETCVAFAVAYCEAGGVRRDAYSDELACVAAWDALHMILHCRELAPPTVLAADLGVDKKTYRRLRDVLYRIWRASLNEYWAELGIAIRRVRKLEREVPFLDSARSMVLEGCVSGDALFARNGNWFTKPTPNPDNL